MIYPESQTSAQVWELIEQDFTLRLSLVSSEWSEEHRKAWNAVFAEGRKRGNSAYVGPALVGMMIADADKRAEWAYQVCCEIWELQGHIKCRAFFRAIFDFCLQQMFAARESCFRHEYLQGHKRMGTGTPQVISGVIGQMTREMAKLRAKWNTKLEIATRDNEYQQQQKQRQNMLSANTPPTSVSWLAALKLRRMNDIITGKIPLESWGPFAPMKQVSSSQAKTDLPKPKTRKPRTPGRKTRVIFGAIQSGLTGLKYCALLDARKLRPPEQWKEEGCPETYALAYKNPKWRKRIQDEKCRFRKEYVNTPLSERETIIQGAAVTRPARQ